MKNTWPILLILLIGGVLGRSLFPKKIDTGRHVPQIVTKYDTVKVDVYKKWIVHDTVTKFTTDTFNLVVKQTIFDTVVINVGQRDSTRSRLWPIVSFQVNSRDTATVRTFNLRTGIGALSQIYTPGPLNALFADTSATPHMTFGTYPEWRTSTLTKILWGSAGFGLCSVTNWANHQLGNR